MACRVGNTLVRVELDCTGPDRVRGRIWLEGRASPVELDLEGRADPDLDGALAVLENPSPRAESSPPLTSEQTGRVRLFTLSHRIRLARGARAQTAPLRNVVHLEWESATNGRVVVSGGGWATRLDPRRPPAPPPARPPREVEPTEGDALDEFACERTMRDADEMVETYTQLEREYADHPDKERLLARDMGWTWMEETEPDDLLGQEEVDPAEPNPQPEPPELVPDPATEGRDWIRTEHGTLRHPLAHRALEFADGLRQDLCPPGAVEPADLDPDLDALLFNTRSLAAKLTGALHDVVYGDARLPGMVVAYLKRALGYFNQSVHTLDLVQRRGRLSAERVAEYRNTLHGFRGEILDLMERFRREA
jgi:hypothetical protein